MEAYKKKREKVKNAKTDGKKDQVAALSIMQK